ncbi:MAG: hypothetical protein ACE5MB_05795 [Anaerolineae bacterium]
MAISALDALLRRLYHVQEFTQEEDCILRLAPGRSDREITLSDGTRVARGEAIGILHFWNEHIPLMPIEGPDLGWGIKFYRQLLKSLQALAVYVESEPQFKELRAFRGETAFVFTEGLEQYERVFGRLGFDFVARDESAGKMKHFGEFWENFYVWALIWAFNPGSLRGKDLFRLQRCQIWISRQVLLERYGSNHEEG